MYHYVETDIKRKRWRWIGHVLGKGNEASHYHVLVLNLHLICCWKLNSHSPRLNMLKKIVEIHYNSMETKLVTSIIFLKGFYESICYILKPLFSRKIMTRN